MSTRRPLIIVGWVLLALLFSSIFLVMLLAVLEGRGAIPSPSARAGEVVPIFPIAYVVTFAVVGLIGMGWLIAFLFRKPKKAAQRSSPVLGQADTPAPQSPQENQLPLL
jgi:hypothetical protein